MAIRHYKYVWNTYKRSGSHKLVFLALAEYAGETTDKCYPSMQTLADMACISVRQVVNIIDDLKKSGDIEVIATRGRGKSNNYRIILKSEVEFTLLSEIETEENVKPSTNNVKPSTNNVKPSTEKCEMGFNRTTNEPLITTNTKDSSESLQTLVSVASPEPAPQKIETESPQVAKPQQESLLPPLQKEFRTVEVPPKKEQKRVDPRVRKVIDAFVKARGSSKGINYPAEGVAAKKILHDFGTDDYEALVVETFQWLKRDDFWKYRTVGLATIFKNIENYLRYKNRGGSAVNGTNGASNETLLRVGHVELEWDESKFGNLTF